jgi:hypothetical protein
MHAIPWEVRKDWQEVWAVDHTNEHAETHGKNTLENRSATVA